MPNVQPVTNRALTAGNDFIDWSSFAPGPGGPFQTNGGRTFFIVDLKDGQRSQVFQRETQGTIQQNYCGAFNFGEELLAITVRTIPLKLWFPDDLVFAAGAQVQPYVSYNQGGRFVGYFLAFDIGDRPIMGDGGSVVASTLIHKKTNGTPTEPKATFLGGALETGFSGFEYYVEVRLDQRTPMSVNFICNRVELRF